MAPKAHLLNSWKWLFGACFSTVVLGSCGQLSPTEKPLQPEKDYSVVETLIPNDTLLATASTLSMNNGIYFQNNKPYSGIVKELYTGGSVKSYRSVYQGMLYGKYKSFYANGNPFEIRQYRNNLGTGRHYGYWPDGIHLKFDYNYYEEKREGAQKKWYQNGRPYLFASFVNDHEEGLQQGWRENGKLFLNYVAHNGYNYGLQQTALCYTLLNEKIKSKE